MAKFAGLQGETFQIPQFEFLHTFTYCFAISTNNSIVLLLNVLRFLPIIRILAEHCSKPWLICLLYFHSIFYKIVWHFLNVGGLTLVNPQMSLTPNSGRASVVGVASNLLPRAAICVLFVVNVFHASGSLLCVTPRVYGRLFTVLFSVLPRVYCFYRWL